MNRRKRVRKNREIGWREFVELPDLDLPAFRAKIDTGARTSALHATRQKIVEHAGEEYVEFHVPFRGRPSTTRCRAPLVARRLIKNTSGIPEERLIVRTTLVLGPDRWPIEVSLADRENMGFELILGRTAVRGRRLVINPGRSYLLTRKKQKIIAAPKNNTESAPAGEESP